MTSVTYKSQPSTHETRGKIPLAGDDRVFKVSSLIWPPEVETFISTLLLGSTLHVCCGKSRLGDVRLDLHEESADIRCDAADMREFVADQSFDTVLYDGPYNSRLAVLHKILGELPRIARKRIVIQAWYCSATKEGYYRKAQDRFALTEMYAWQPNSYFGRMNFIQVFDARARQDETVQTYLPARLNASSVEFASSAESWTIQEVNTVYPADIHPPVIHPAGIHPVTWQPPPLLETDFTIEPKLSKPYAKLSAADNAARRTLGDFATPRCYAELAHDYLARAVGGPEALYGRAWWDMAAGTGTLTLPCPAEMTGPLFLSSLITADVESMGDQNPSGAESFVYDFLNDADETLPDALQVTLQTQREWVFLVNPPFTASTTVRGSLLPSVSQSAVARGMAKRGFKRAAHVSTLQFLYRLLLMTERHGIQATVGVFSQASFLTHDSYGSFRERFEETFRYQCGYCVNGAEFGAQGQWPLAFTVWSNQRENPPGAPAASLLNSYNTDVFERGKCIGQKQFRNVDKPLSRWTPRLANTVPALPLTSAVKVDYSVKVVLNHLPEGALGYCAFTSNDVMHSKNCFLLSSAYARGAGWGITPAKFEQSLVALGARCLVKSNWLNDRDQFCEPNGTASGYRQWSYDLILWLLTSNFNHSASFTADYGGKSYKVTNNFFWMSPDEVAAVPNMPEAIVRQAEVANTPFAAQWLEMQSFSCDAAALMGYMKDMVVATAHLREIADLDYHLLNWDAGWYQIRQGMLWQKKAPRRAGELVELYREFKRDHVALGERLLAGIYEYGLLPLSG